MRNFTSRRWRRTFALAADVHLAHAGLEFLLERCEAEALDHVRDRDRRDRALGAVALRRVRPVGRRDRDLLADAGLEVARRAVARVREAAADSKNDDVERRARRGAGRARGTAVRGGTAIILRRDELN